MTSEREAKTNEFLRRRKLRLQQVREQSKDIAKKLRQRAKLEQLEHILDLNSTKAKDYLQHQNHLIQRLEQLYEQGVKNVGSSHQKASEVTHNVSTAKTDLSKVRAREAALELRRKRQEKLDEHKKILDRKLLAREVANEKSRERSTGVPKKLHAKSTSTINPLEVAVNVVVNGSKNKDENVISTVNKNDMATQWDYEEVPNEWEPTVPKLSLPKEDKESLKDSNNIPESKSEKSKRLDLFALSSEMPSSLRCGSSDVVEERAPVKQSLTMVSEYLQSRALRLRETDASGSSKRQADDLQSIKQTILHTRSSKIEGTASNVCHVLDEQVIPMPSWQAESKCEFYPHSSTHHSCGKSRQLTITNSQIHKIFGTMRPVLTDVHPTPVLRGSSPFRRNKVFPKISNNAAKATDKSSKSAGDSLLGKKSSVTMYNHSTRNSKDIPCHDIGLVVRDSQQQENAYSQALQETSIVNAEEKEHLKKIQEMRNKVAMTKQTVEKEYNDTMSFLKSLPKEKCNKHKKSFHMDENRQQTLKDKRQLKLQQEFSKIEKDFRKSCCGKNLKTQRGEINTSSRRSKSPHNGLSNEIDPKDLQYSWMPVPEGDGNLVVHTIPTTVKEGKTGNTVKFSKVDSYHEYRSRHKHTPPTKDTNGPTHRIPTETVHIENDGSETSDSADTSSDTSSVENLNLRPQNNKKGEHLKSEHEKIVIYKILDSRTVKKQKERKKLKLIDDVAKALKSMDADNFIGHNNESVKSTSKTNEAKSSPPLESLNEGVYKVVNEKGQTNIVTNCFAANIEMWQSKTDRKPWWDNIASLYYDTENDKITLNEDKANKNCLCSKNSKQNTSEAKENLHSGSGDITDTRTSNCVDCNCGCHIGKDKENLSNLKYPSAATSTSSFKTAANVDQVVGVLPDGRYVKLLDHNSDESGKFYIGASGFLKDNAYEVVIQLRKKDSTNDKTPENIATEELISSVQENKNPDLSVQCSQTNEKPDIVTKIDKEETKICNDVDQEKEQSEVTVNKSQNLNTDNSRKDSSEQNTNLSGVESRTKDCLQSSTKQLVDKGDCTTSQLSFAIPSDYPKTDPLPRPATSTYTQTSLNSPTARPAFLHMSSSTSTAYMSPPEMVLPKCLQHKKMCNISDIVKIQDEIFQMKDHKIYNKSHEECACKQCMQHERHMKHKWNLKLSSTKQTNRNKNTSPSPQILDETSNSDKQFISHTKRNAHKKCSKCVNRCMATDNNHNKYNNKCRVPSSKLTSRNVFMHLSSSASKSLKNNAYDKVNKSKLNPMVKSYVNKLLELNSNGLKAIEINNQDCSSISTPGSSVINVPRNIIGSKATVNNKISLQQIKDSLKQQILQECLQENISEHSCDHSKKSKTCLSKVPKGKKSLHKIKSLNISKNILKAKKSNLQFYPTSQKIKSNQSTSSPSSTKDVFINKRSASSKPKSKSLPTPRFFGGFLSGDSASTKNNCSDISDIQRGSKSTSLIHKNNINNNNQQHFGESREKHYNLPLHKATLTSQYNETHKQTDRSLSSSTQTAANLESEINLMKLAEDKIQNMEKIADLTEKCTQRLSNLAKVLEEVRRNKSLAYSQVSTSDTASDSDHKSDKIINIEIDHTKIYQPNIEIQKKANKETPSLNDRDVNSAYEPFLKDIPKPETDKYTNKPITLVEDLCNIPSNNKDVLIKSKAKPPPALSRVNLKHGQGIVPHELSTVVEVDSPMSIKLKNQSSNEEIADSLQLCNNIQGANSNQVSEKKSEPRENPDLLPNKPVASKGLGKISGNDSSDDSKMQMMDIKQFNEVMLKPFISLQEYAKQCNVGVEEGSNIDDHLRDDLINDELSSLHSDGSLPDVIAELLKRNIIAEPFKFESASNANSTTVSSESTISILALSKIRKEKRKASVVFRNKENISESSDTLSVSSNPDLENAFKRLGMGWASSTLKKTKERLALSSSSNTSSSSLSHYKLKSSKPDIPVLVTDSVSSMNNISNKQKRDKNGLDDSKNAEQQTSFMNSMTVKEFLTNELAKKITFTNKSYKNDTGEEFVSLLETKIPDEMKNSSLNIREDQSSDSFPSGNNNRARTSTPVQIFKSMTYHSSSSSHVSNGLFSNVDDLSSVKGTSNSMRNHSTSEKEDLTIPNCSLKVRKLASDCSN